MKGMGKEKISDVAGIDGDELREVVGGTVPVIFLRGRLGRLLCDQAHIEERDGERKFQFCGGVEILLRLGVIVKGEIDGAQISVGRGTNLSVSRMLQSYPVVRRGLPQVTVLLSIDSEIEPADGISRLQGGSGTEVGDGFVVSALARQGIGKVVFRHVIVGDDGQRVSPKTEIIMPVT